MVIRRNGGGLAAVGVGAIALAAAFLPVEGASAARTSATSTLTCPEAVGPGPLILPGPAFDSLNGVTALSAKQAWAVGTSGDSPSIDQFNGSKWSSVDAGALDVIGQFRAAAKFPGGAWAVGGGGPSDTALRPFIVRLTGTKSGTKVQRISTPKLPVGQLLAVSATSAKDAWAGGFLGKGGTPVLLHWNGKSWARSSFPGGGAIAAILEISAKNVWVTDVSDKTGSQVWNWNGKKWRQTAIPALNGKTGYSLDGLSATSPKDIWAVGFFLDSDVVAHTVSLH